MLSALSQMCDFRNAKCEIPGVIVSNACPSVSAPCSCSEQSNAVVKFINQAFDNVSGTKADCSGADVKQAISHNDAIAYTALGLVVVSALLTLSASLKAIQMCCAARKAKQLKVADKQQ